MQVILLQHTEDPEQVVAQAARLCYSAVGLNAIAEKMTPEKRTQLIRQLIQMGHVSALEHATFTFGVEGVSRALTHQLVRHRLASYSQQSQRYVALRDFAYVTPPHLEARPDLLAAYQQSMQQIGEIYTRLLDDGVPPEDARYLLPNACETKIVVSMNARELLHFFRLRCCNRAQWEIRLLGDKMLALAKKAAPTIFQAAGPGCLAGPCPEGKMTCGQTADVRRKYQDLNA